MSEQPPAAPLPPGPPPSVPPASVPHPSAPATHGGHAWFVVMLVFGILLTWAGIGTLSGGIATAAGTAIQGADGYVSTKARPLSTSGYALTSPRVPGFTVAGDPGTLPFDLASVRLAVSSNDGDDIFVGIGPQADVERYLKGVEHSEVTAIPRAHPRRHRRGAAVAATDTP